MPRKYPNWCEKSLVLSLFRRMEIRWFVHYSYLYWWLISNNDSLYKQNDFSVFLGLNNQINYCASEASESQNCTQSAPGNWHLKLLIFVHIIEEQTIHLTELGYLISIDNYQWNACGESSVTVTAPRARVAWLIRPFPRSWVRGGKRVLLWICINDGILFYYYLIVFNGFASI